MHYPIRQPPDESTYFGEINTPLQTRTGHTNAEAIYGATYGVKTFKNYRKIRERFSYRDTK